MVTVSEPLAQWLQRDHGLDRLPDVVLNAPVEVPDGRRDEHCPRRWPTCHRTRPSSSTCGGVNRARGINTVVRALPPCLASTRWWSPGTTPSPASCRATRRAAGRRRPLPSRSVSSILSWCRATSASATVGISPLLRAPNHDIAVTNKFCEYIAAGIADRHRATHPAQADLVTNWTSERPSGRRRRRLRAGAIRQFLADRDRFARRISHRRRTPAPLLLGRPGRDDLRRLPRSARKAARA